LLYHEQGRAEEAEAQWCLAVAERPDFIPGWLGLAEVYLACQRWVDLDAVASQLEKFPDGLSRASVLRARSHLARRDFAEARGRVQEAIDAAPDALFPRLILSHVLLQEGRDWNAAERALRDVLALAPAHPEARHNLSLLLAQQGRLERPI
jgi:tetratricopeptide (TPR) repeat protein